MSRFDARKARDALLRAASRAKGRAALLFVPLSVGCGFEGRVLGHATPADARADTVVTDVSADTAFPDVSMDASVPDVRADAFVPDASADATVRDAHPDGPSDARIDDTLPPEAATGVFGVGAGFYHACAIARGLGACWGDDTWDDDPNDIPDSAAPLLLPKAIDPRDGWEAIVASMVHTCGIRRGEVWCWGSNERGQLGRADLSSTAPARVVLPHQATEVAAGDTHSCALLTTGELYCWGDNNYGQLGPGNRGTVDPMPRAVAGWKGVRHVAAGQSQTGAIREDGSFYCWGIFDDGRCGIDTDGQSFHTSEPTFVGAATDWTALALGQSEGCGLRGSGELYCWGTWRGMTTPDSATPARIGSDADWAAVSSNIFARCAVKKNGDLYCWGSNNEGQLGMGDFGPRSVPTLVPGGRSYRSVSVGRFAVCAVDIAGDVYCSGDNRAGQLGQGDRDRRATFTRVTLPP